LGVIGPPVFSEPYVIVVPADAPDLLREVNAALAKLAADGALAEIQARWLRPAE
jgi:ABC-type amino acid transport substrate-binding protein